MENIWFANRRQKALCGLVTIDGRAGRAERDFHPPHRHAHWHLWYKSCSNIIYRYNDFQRISKKWTIFRNYVKKVEIHMIERQKVQKVITVLRFQCTIFKISGKYIIFFHHHQKHCDDRWHMLVENDMWKTIKQISRTFSRNKQFSRTNNQKNFMNNYSNILKLVKHNMIYSYINFYSNFMFQNKIFHQKHSEKNVFISSSVQKSIRVLNYLQHGEHIFSIMHGEIMFSVIFSEKNAFRTEFIW